MKSRENSADLISNVILAEIFALKARTFTQKLKTYLQFNHFEIID